MLHFNRSSAPLAARWSMLAALTMMGVGCTSETPSDAPPKAEADKSTVEKVEDKAVEIGHKVEGAAGTAVKATGDAIVRTGEKLETDAAKAVKDNVGEKAGQIVESTGKGLEKAGAAVGSGGDKLKDAAKP